MWHFLTLWLTHQIVTSIDNLSRCSCIPNQDMTKYSHLFSFQTEAGFFPFSMFHQITFIIWYTSNKCSPRHQIPLSSELAFSWKVAVLAVFTSAMKLISILDWNYFGQISVKTVEVKCRHLCDRMKSLARGSISLRIDSATSEVIRTQLFLVSHEKRSAQSLSHLSENLLLIPFSFHTCSSN